MSLVFDTLKLSKSLGRAFTPEQAEVLTEALTINIGDNLATKSDLSVMSAELKAEIAALDVKLTGEIAALDTKLTTRIAAVETALANTRAELIRWIVTSFAGNVITMVTIALAVVQLVAPK